MIMIVKKYSEFIKINENAQNSEDILIKMANYISRRFKKENSIIFTYWIGLIFGFSKFLFISKIEMSEDFKDVAHVYIIIGDKYYDGEGFHNREDIFEKFHISKWSFNDYTFFGNLENLKKCIDVKQLKLSGKLEKELKIILQKYKEMIK